MRPTGDAAGEPGPRLPASLIGRLKNRVITPGARPRTIVRGALKGLRMQLDLEHHAQVFLGTYEHEVHQWLRRLGRNAATALDVGAADGAYTLYFLKRTPATRVYAFEPDPAARGLLLDNLRLNGLEGDHRVRVIGSAAGRGGTPDSVSLDSLYEDVAVPALVKLDVEGHEADVLAGAGRLLARGGLSWIVETHSPELERACIQLLERHGLAVRVLSPAWWRFALPERRPIPHNRWLIAADARQERA